MHGFLPEAVLRYAEQLSLPLIKLTFLKRCHVHFEGVWDRTQEKRFIFYYINSESSCTFNGTVDGRITFKIWSIFSRATLLSHKKWENHLRKMFSFTRNESFKLMKICNSTFFRWNCEFSLNCINFASYLNTKHPRPLELRIIFAAMLVLKNREN